MKRAALVLLAAIGLAGHALAQSSPNLYYNQVPSNTQWNSYFAGKVDVNGGLLQAPTITNPGISGGTLQNSTLNNPTLNGAIFNSATLNTLTLNNSLTIGPAQQLVCLGTDDTTLVQQALNNLAQGESTVLHGTCAVNEALAPVTMNGVSATISGDGLYSTTLNVNNGNPGMVITIEAAASVTVQGMAIIRTQTSPALGQTALSITAVPTANVYTGLVTIRDVKIGGSFPGGANTNSWNTGLVLNSVGGTLLINDDILGLNETTNTGDVGVNIAAPTTNNLFTAGLQFQNSTVQGFATGVVITGQEQGISFISTPVLGDWQGINVSGAGPNVNVNTSAQTTSGTTLQFAPGSLSGITVPTFVSGTNIPAEDYATSVNNTTGVVVLGQAVTGTVASGATITFNQSYQQEALTVIYGSFAANDHAILCTYCSLTSITNSNFGAFGANANWVGIELDHGNNNYIEDNPFISGSNTASAGYGILISNTGRAGLAPNIIMGNGIFGVGHCVYLKGTSTVNTQVIGNSYECPSGFSQDAATGNQNLANMNTFGAIQPAPDITTSGGVMTLNPAENLATATGSFDFMGTDFTLTAPSGYDGALFFARGTTGRWGFEMTATAETGGNAGSDLNIAAYSDTSALLHVPISITRSSGIVTINTPLEVSDIGLGALFEINSTPPNDGNLVYSTLISGAVNPRWFLYKTGTAESGGNVGSDFSIVRVSDAGTNIDAPLSITRSTGVVNFTDGVSVGGGHTGGVTCSGTPTSSFAAVGGIITHC